MNLVLTLSVYPRLFMGSHILKYKSQVFIWVHSLRVTHQTIAIRTVGFSLPGFGEFDSLSCYTKKVLKGRWAHLIGTEDLA